MKVFRSDDPEYLARAERARAGWTPERRAEQSRRWKDRSQNPTVGRPKGSKNVNPYPKTKAVLDRYRNNPPPPWTGKKHKPETKEKMSKSRIRIIEERGLVLAYQGKFRPNFPEKYEGDPTNIIYRSSLELRFMTWLDTNSNIVKWQSEEFFIPYLDPATNKIRRYFVDFKIVAKDGKGGTITKLVEIKPASQCKPPKVPAKKTKRFITEMLTWGTNNAKWSAAREFAADRGWSFEIITDEHLKSWK